MVVVKHKTWKLSFVSAFFQPQSDKCATAKICLKRLLYIVTFCCKWDKKSPYASRNKILFTQKNICFFFNIYFQEFMHMTQDRGYARGMATTSRNGHVYLNVGARSTPEGLMAQINYTYLRWKFINLTRQANLWVPLGVPELWMHKQLIRARWHICKLLTCTTSCCIWSRKTDIRGAARRRQWWRARPSPCEWWRRRVGQEDWGGAKFSNSWGF